MTPSKPLTLNRRAFMSSGLAAAALASGFNPTKVFGQEFAGQTVRFMSHPGGIRPIIDHQIAYIKETLGITVEVIEAGDLVSWQDSLKDLRAGGGQFDVVMHFPRYNGELASVGYLRPLDDLIAKYNAQPLFDNIVDYYRILYTRWGGQTIAAPVDGDVAMMYYRKDAFANPEIMAKFEAEKGRPLTVPVTWDEFYETAAFFTGWDWAGSGKVGYGFQTSSWDRGFIEQQWAPMMGSYGGVWMDDNASPGWNNAAGVTALEGTKRLLDYAPPGSASMNWGNTMESFSSEDIALTLWYMDIGRGGLGMAAGNPLEKIGYAEWPGATVDGVTRNYNSMFFGRVVGISEFAANPDAAFAVITTLLTPARRVLSLDDPASGSDMFLKTDYDPANFKNLKPAPEFLVEAQKVLSKGFPEMTMPAIGEYIDALQGAIHGYVNGGTDAAAALQEAADRWEAITDRYGRDAQKAYWAEVKQSYVDAGLNIAG